jgi:UDP-N-acetylglucosamine 2-epimerase (non-hydrolysing)
LFGKPVLVVRDTIERPEAVSAGTVHLMCTDKCSHRQRSETKRLLRGDAVGMQMAFPHNHYGDRVASQRIRNTLEELAVKA